MKSRSWCLSFGHVLDQQRPGHFAAFDQRLVHAEHVGAPLRLVGAHRAGGVQHAGGHHPAGARLQAVGLREVEDAVVALVPVLQAAADVGLGGARLQAHERVVEMVLGGVQLRREVVALGLALLAGQGGVLGLLVHVVRDGAHVVEELRVDRPALVLVPHRLADRAARRPRPRRRGAGTAGPRRRRSSAPRRPRGCRWRPRWCWRTSVRRCRRDACPGRTSRSGPA